MGANLSAEDYFQNAEYMGYEFVNDLGFSLAETEESKKSFHVPIAQDVPNLVVTPPTPRQSEMRRSADARGVVRGE